MKRQRTPNRRCREGAGRRARGFASSALVWVSAGVVVAAPVSYYVYRNWKENQALVAKVSDLAVVKDAATREAERLKGLLAEKEEAFRKVQRESFQDELAAAQAALAEANGRLERLTREKSDLENSSLILDSRLKNTTNELTRALAEQKRSREAMSGIEGQYQMKIAQLYDTLRQKGIQIQDLQGQPGDKEFSTAEFLKREQELSATLSNYETRIAELEQNAVSLKRAMAEKEQAFLEAQEGLRRIQGKRETEAGQVAALEKERNDLKQKLSGLSQEVANHQQLVRGFEQKLAALNQSLAQGEAALFKKETELTNRAKEIEALKTEVVSLKAAAASSSKTAPLFSVSQQQLQERVRMLEQEKSALEERLAETGRKGSVGAQASVRDSSSDANIRVMTEALAKKEVQLKQLEKELETLRTEKFTRTSDSAISEKRVRELEMLVATLTRQLGDYAIAISQKDAELKESSVRLIALTQDLEAQKVAAAGLQRELADAKTWQEKTFENLTQIVGVEAGGPYSGRSVPTAPVVSKKELVEAQKKASELKKQVEVLLEQK